MVKEIKKVVLVDEVDTKAHYKVEEVINSFLDFIGEDLVGLRAGHVLDYKTKILPICKKLMSRFEWDEDADTISGYSVAPTLTVFCISLNLFVNDDVLYQDLVACELNGEKPTARYEFFKANFAGFLDGLTHDYQYEEYLLETFGEFFVTVFDDVANSMQCDYITNIRHFGGYGRCKEIYERIHDTILRYEDSDGDSDVDSFIKWSGGYDNYDDTGNKLDEHVVRTNTKDVLHHIDKIVEHGFLSKDSVPALSEIIFGLLAEQVAVEIEVFFGVDLGGYFEAA